MERVKKERVKVRCAAVCGAVVGAREEHTHEELGWFSWCWAVIPRLDGKEDSRQRFEDRQVYKNVAA